MSFFNCELGNLFFLYRESVAANFVKIHRILKSKVNIIPDQDNSNFVYLQDPNSNKYLYCNFDDPDSKIYVGDTQMKFELIKNDDNTCNFKYQDKFLYADPMIFHLTLGTECENKTNFKLE